MKKKVAVFFGGKSFEHDVSILTGLQVLQVIDVTKYDAMPVYVDTDGVWWTGKALLDMRNYPLDSEVKKKLSMISLDLFVEEGQSPRFKVEKAGFFAKKYINFDVAFFAFHGNVGENGFIQGLMEVAKVPYTGADVLSSAVYMSKITTKAICRDLGIKVLDEVVINKPKLQETFDIEKLLNNVGKIKYPVCVKPVNLGSSVGVTKANNDEELFAAVLSVFKLDTQVIIEPFVKNLKEYNIAVMKNLDDEIVTSAIESPVGKDEFLDFKDKYLAGGNGGSKKMGPAKLAVPTEGLLSMGREFEPDMTKDMRSFVEDSAKKLFAFMGATGNPRIDFLCNSKTCEMWLNEVNPIPGAFAFYLWEKSKYRIGYGKLVDTIIQNALKRFDEKKVEINLKTSASIIFKKH